jgi:hypothetical protein
MHHVEPSSDAKYTHASPLHSILVALGLATNVMHILSQEAHSLFLPTSFPSVRVINVNCEQNTHSCAKRFTVFTLMNKIANLVGRPSDRGSIASRGRICNSSSQTPRPAMVAKSTLQRVPAALCRG